MQNEKPRFVGVNALQKMLALLVEFNVASVKEGAVDVTFRPDGSGVLTYMVPSGNGNAAGTTIFAFADTEHLMTFLQAAPVERLKMVQ